jgi:hypothetical protein
MAFYKGRYYRLSGGSMKLKSLVVATFMCLASSAFAQWFPATVHVTVLPFQVAVQVVNPYHYPIICNGQVFGQTSHGPVFTTYFAEQFLPVGGHRYAYVQTNLYSPFVNGWANLHCRFAHYW